MTCPHGAPTRWRCRPCNADYMRDYMRDRRRRDRSDLVRPKKAWLQAAILTHLAAADTPVGATALLAHTGAADVIGLRAAVKRARRAGHAIASVKEGRTVRYRLEAV